MNLGAGIWCAKCIINIGKYSDFYNRGAAKFFQPWDCAAMQKSLGTTALIYSIALVCLKLNRKLIVSSTRIPNDITVSLQPHLPLNGNWRNTSYMIKIHNYELLQHFTYPEPNSVFCNSVYFVYIYFSHFVFPVHIPFFSAWKHTP